MHYIRLLKPPTINSTRTISTVLTITTDLGDSFLPHDVSLSCTILCNYPSNSTNNSNDDHAEEVSRKVVDWAGSEGMRSLPVQMIVRGKESREMVLRIESHASSTPESPPLAIKGQIYIVLPPIIPATSAPITPTTSKTLRRDFNRLRIWEDTGESIARRVWDAGVALSTVIQTRGEAWRSLYPILSRQRRTRIIELGCGTAIVGLSLASTLTDCTICVSDLAEHSSFIIKNITANTSLIHHSTSITFTPLNWTEDIPTELSDRYDLIIAADVTYNPDSYGALVRTIKGLKGEKVLIAMKKRHASEAGFFGEMERAGFVIGEKLVVFAPMGVHPEDLEGTEEIEIFSFHKGVDE